MTCAHCGIELDVLEVTIEVDGDQVQLCSNACYHDFLDEKLDDERANQGDDR